MEKRMVGIKQAVRESRWEDAAKALSSALSELDRERQITLVQFLAFILFEELREIYGNKQSFRGDLEKYLDNGHENYPWIVHFLDSQQVIRNVQYDRRIKKFESSALLAEAVWDMVTGVQAKVWADEDPEDFSNWKNNENLKGLYENNSSIEAGKRMWNAIDKMIKADPHFRGLEDGDIYKDRPAAEVFETLIS